MTRPQAPASGRRRPERWAITVSTAAAVILSIAACSGSTGTPSQSVGSAAPSVATPSSAESEAPASSAPGVASPGASAEAGSGGAADGTPIRVTIGNTTLTGRLWDTATARDLLSLLPLTLTFSDLNHLEKIGHLPRDLSTDDAPAGDDPVPTDIGYYAPWRNLVFYYGDVGYFDGIVRIGQFDGSVEAIASQTDDFSATIDLGD